MPPIQAAAADTIGISVDSGLVTELHELHGSATDFAGMWA
jgi:hypothetical protein